MRCRSYRNYGQALERSLPSLAFGDNYDPSIHGPGSTDKVLELLMNKVPVVDWGPILQYPESEIECQCGTIFLSHAKSVNHDGQLVRVLRKPCPSCGKQLNPRRTSSPPENFKLG